MQPNEGECDLCRVARMNCSALIHLTAAKESIGTCISQVYGKEAHKTITSIIWNWRKAGIIPLFHKAQLLDGSFASPANSHPKAFAK